MNRLLVLLVLLALVAVPRADADTTVTGPIVFSTGLTVNGNTVTTTGGIPPLAGNPSATACATPINGSAITYTRSDGAPAVCVMTATTGGLTPTPPNDATKFLSGAGTFIVPSGSSGANPTATAGDTAVNGAAATFLRSDGAPAVRIMTSTVNGLVPTPPNDATKYLDGTGHFTVPPGTAPVGANPTASAGAVAINGAAATFMRSDGAPAVAVMNATTAGLVPTPPNNTTTFLRGDATFAVPPGSTAANPTGKVGPVVANGVSTSFMRADAAPPIDETLNYVWTGSHTFGTVLGTINPQAGTSYTLAATDCGETVRFTNGAAITLTLLNTIGAGCAIAVEQAAAGQITVVAGGAGATLVSAHSFTKTFGQWSIIGLFVDGNAGGTAANYVLTGDGA